MAIISKDGFDFIDNIHGQPDALILTGEDLTKEIEYIRQTNVKSIYLNYFKSKRIFNLDFLKEINFIEKVNVNDLDIDYHGLYNLHNLQSAILSIKNNKQHLDYSYFKNLNYLSVDWYSQFPNLSKNKRLKELIIWKFKPKTANFNELRGMEQLESLKITQSNITSFMGMENFVELKKFEGYYLSNLESLNGINKVSKHIKVLVLEKCKKLINYQSNLEKLRVLEKLILTDCGQLQNLKFINNLERLKFFSFLGTNVKDGNLFPLERNRLDYFSFNNSPHYSHKIDTDNTFKKK